MRTKLLFCVTALLFSWLSWGEEYRARLHLKSADEIDGLYWDPSPETQEPQLQTHQTLDNRIVYYVKLKGIFTRKESRLLYQNETVRLDSNLRFTMEIPLESDETEFSLIAISPQGDTQVQGVEILYPNWDDLFVEHEKPSAEVIYTNSRQFSISPEVGLTSISYQQSNVVNYSGFAVTGKLLSDFSLSDVWKLEGEIYYTLFPVMSNTPGMNIQFLGTSLGLGYELPKFSPNWSLTIMTGFYYTTSFTSSADFGFGDISGPQLYPLLRTTFSGGSSSWLYFRYSPIFSGFALLDLSNAELAGGLGYSFPPSRNQQIFSIKFDIALLSLLLQNTSIQSDTYVLSANYRF